MTILSDAPMAEQSDEDLVERARRGDEDAVAELLGRCRGQVHGRTRSYFLAGGDRQDVLQEGMIGLYKAIRDYDRAKHPSFRHFADLCITRQIITAVKGATRRKHAPLNTYVSLTRPVSLEDESGSDLHDRLADDGQDPVHRVTSSAELASLRAFCTEVLSDLECEVLTRFVTGQSYAEIAGDLGRRTKTIDNALQRIKRKLEQYLTLRTRLAA